MVHFTVNLKGRHLWLDTKRGDRRIDQANLNKGIRAASNEKKNQSIPENDVFELKSRRYQAAMAVFPLGKEAMEGLRISGRSSSDSPRVIDDEVGGQAQHLRDADAADEGADAQQQRRQRRRRRPRRRRRRPRTAPDVAHQTAARQQPRSRLHLRLDAQLHRLFVVVVVGGSGVVIWKIILLHINWKDGTHKTSQTWQIQNSLIECRTR